MQSKAATVEQYLAELPPDRRAAISVVRDVIRKNLDRDYREGMAYGHIGYFVPHSIFPPGYHCDPSKPLPFAGLGWQKNHMSLGIMSNYGGSAEEKWFRAAWLKSGKKLDMGACCVRFKKVEDVPLDVIAESIRRMPAQKFIAHYQKALLTMNKAAAKRAAAKKATPKKPAAKKSTGRRPAGKKAAAR